MSEPIQAYPLQWPVGWKRTDDYARGYGKFGKRESAGSGGWRALKDLTITQGLERVIDELGRMGVARDDLVISSNIPLRLDGLPRGDASNPADPGVAVYWRKGKATRCMAIDQYRRVADNLAAISATLEAMRAIERHGGAMIMDRAFMGFTALPAPEQWFQVLGVPAAATTAEIQAAYRKLAVQHHPDKAGGSAEQMARINTARDEGLAQARS